MKFYCSRKSSQIEKRLKSEFHLHLTPPDSQAVEEDVIFPLQAMKGVNELNMERQRKWVWSVWEFFTERFSSSPDMMKVQY